MANIIGCFNTSCKYNCGGCYCGSYDIEIDTDGSCLSFIENKDTED